MRVQEHCDHHAAGVIRDDQQTRSPWRNGPKGAPSGGGGAGFFCNNREGSRKRVLDDGQSASITSQVIHEDGLQSLQLQRLLLLIIHDAEHYNGSG